MMPWKLLAFIAVMALVLVFVGFNLDNRCDISIVFVTFRSVPVVITILATYVLGLLSAFFLAVGRRGRSGSRVSASRHAAGSGGAADNQVPGGAFHGAGAAPAPKEPGDQPGGKRRARSGRRSS